MSTPLELGSSLVLRLERAATGGAVALSETGQVVFVRHGLPGETVKSQVTEVAKSFLRADVVGVQSPSHERVPAPCPHAGARKCGGCDLQHASLEAQLQWKSDVVSEHLKRIAGISWRVEVTASQFSAEGSRTRLRCAVDEDGRLGQRRYRSHEIERLDNCWLADPRLAPAFEGDWTGADEVELRAIGNGDPFAVIRRDDADESIYEITTLSGSTLPVDTVSTVDVGANKFRVGPLSFWQSHREAPPWLVEQVMRLIGAGSGDRVADLFCGVGLFTVPLAKAVGASGRVTGVENSEDSVADALANGAGLRQMNVHRWSVAPRSINDVVGRGDLVVMDPPRSGIGITGMKALLARGPRRMVYVSCDAATFARDLRVALDGGYDLRELQARDLFPMTEHVELVGVLDERS